MMKFQDLVNLVYQTQNIHVLQNLYNWSIVDVHDISVLKYNISKKLSEVNIANSCMGLQKLTYIIPADIVYCRIP